MSSDIFETILAQGLTKIKTDKQRKIIETAIKLFAEKGYANTSTAEIAKIAGVSEGTIFKHYGTKDKLLLSVILPFAKDFIPSMAEEVLSETSKKATSFEQFLRELLKDRVAFIKENKEIFQVLIKEVIYKEELKQELFAHFKKYGLPLWENIVDQFKEDRESIHLPTDRLFKLLFSVIGGFFITRFVLIDNFNISDDDIEDTVQFIMNGLRSKEFRK